MGFRVAHITDTHLSRDKPFFVANFNVVAAAIAASAPDLVINTGDVSLDGVANVDDLVEAHRLHTALPGPVRFIPGNHDVGECHDVPGSAEARISAAGRASYISQFGEDYWQLDIPGWRVIAVNSQLLGSSLEAASQQLEFVAQAAAVSGARRIALFVHKPLFDASPSETLVGGRFVNPAARRELLGALGSRTPAVVASGHVHQYRSSRAGETECVWGPSTGFIIPDERQPCYGEKEVGYVEHRFTADGQHTHRFVRVPGTVRLDIEDFLDAYHAKS